MMAAAPERVESTRAALDDLTDRAMIRRLALLRVPGRSERKGHVMQA